MSESSHSEDQLPDDPLSETKTLNWFQLNIRYGERPRGGFGATMAFLAPVIVGGAFIAGVELFGQDSGSKPDASQGEIIYSNLSPNALGKMAVNVTMFEGSKPQIEWAQLP